MRGGIMRIEGMCLTPRTVAALLSRRHGVDFKRALGVTERVWEEAERSVLRLAQGKEWQRLSFKERSDICTEVVKRLLDRHTITGLVSGGRRRLI